MTVIADCRGFLQQASLCPLFFSTWTLCSFSRFFLCWTAGRVFSLFARLVCQSFAPDPSLEMLWVLLEEWLLSYLATSLWGLYTSIRQYTFRQDWIWYPGQYLGIRSLSTFCLFLLFHCTPPPPPLHFLNVSVCCWFRSFLHFVFLFQQHFPLSLRPTSLCRGQMWVG